VEGLTIGRDVLMIDVTSISLTDLQKGEETALACEIALVSSPVGPE
jgi:hypothetical protein